VLLTRGQCHRKGINRANLHNDYCFKTSFSIQLHCVQSKTECDGSSYTRLQRVLFLLVQSSPVLLLQLLKTVPVHKWIFFLVALWPNAGYGLLIHEVLDHTRRRATVGRSPLDQWSARRRDLYLTTHNTHKRQTTMPPAGFEPTISAGERPQTHALDRGHKWIPDCVIGSGRPN